jgi:hypothetical protein
MLGGQALPVAGQTAPQAGFIPQVSLEVVAQPTKPKQEGVGFSLF